MKLLFMGNPAFSAKILDKLTTSGLFDSIIVVTSPDSMKGRGYKTSFSEVKKYAVANELPVFQPVNLKAENFKDTLEETAPDVIVVASFGMLLPSYVIDYPKYGCINVHASLLPEYRGAAPINRVIMDGRSETGVTIMRMDNGLDTGDMISKVIVEILPGDNYSTLHDKVADAGAQLLVDTLPDIFGGSAVYEKQNHNLHTYARKISEADRVIDWTESAYTINCKIRGLANEPCALAKTEGGSEFKIYSAEPGELEAPDSECGKVIQAKKIIRIVCGDNTVLTVKELQPAGGKRMLASDAINGRKITLDTKFI
ncbi:MAG: methionyl-tRNA formyltransferase [Ruminococcaceae bacterium]|nr:methionyl-tRNA formyltransferase [Oscillospiraceae bacterium]